MSLHYLVAMILNEIVKVYVLDELNIWSEVEKAVDQQEFISWELEKTDYR